MRTTPARPRAGRLRMKAGAFLLVALFAACGGGGGGGGGAAPPVDGGGGGAGGGGGGPTVQPILNAGLSGQLFMTSPFSVIEFDLATGVSRVLRPRAGGLHASLDGEELAMTDANPPGLEPSDTREQLLFFGRDGRSRSRFLLNDSFSGAPMLSPDRQHVLVEWHSIDDGDAGGVPVPTVFDRDGRIVKRFVDYNNEYAWLPDGDIVLARGDTIYRASLAPGALPQPIRRLPGERPRALTLSPDGRQLAFSIGNFDRLENTTWLMAIDGSGLREIARAAGSSLAPASFSPDGRSLLVAEGINYASIGPGFFFAGCAELYVLPLAASASAPVTIDPDGPAAPALRLRNTSEETGSVNERTCAFMRPSWRALPALSPAVPGTPAQGAGLNRGLAGTLWYAFAAELYRSDLASGQTTRVAGITRNPPAVSLDGSEITVLDRFLPSDPREESVLFLDRNGAPTGRIDLAEGLTAPLKLSPDRNLIAARYENLDLGDAGADRIVTVFTRDFTQQRVRWRGASSWDWMPDGRLLLGGLGEIGLTDTTLQTLDTIASFTDPVSGVTASRDGTRIAFEMNGNLWLMRSDGSGLVQLTETSRPLAVPEFSPDGRHILATSQESPLATWAIPIDGQRVHVMNDLVVGSSAFAVREIGDGGAVALRAAGRVAWR